MQEQYNSSHAVFSSKASTGIQYSRRVTVWLSQNRRLWLVTV